MIIEVRPTSALRRSRVRVVGAVTGVLLLATSFVAATQLGGSAQLGRPDVAVSDPAR